MREYKFRGKRIDNGKWVYGHYFTSPLTDENSGTTPDMGWYFLSGKVRHCIERDHVVFVVNPETIGQHTGLKNKNGTDIYEGDVLLDRYDECQGEVKYSDDDGMYALYTVDNEFYDFADIDSTDFEVIGNIYENP